MADEIVSAVFIESRLVGFLGAPAEPFVFGFFGGSVAHSSMRTVSPLKQFSSSAQFNRNCFSEADFIYSLAVSEHLVVLAEQYGVAFPTELSQLFTYEPSRKGLYEQLSFRLAAENSEKEVVCAFTSLVRAWLDVNTRNATSALVKSEATLMRSLIVDLLNTSSELELASFDWSDDWTGLVTHMFTPESIRVRNRVFASYDRSEQMMVEQGFHHFW
jgi:hypothetical protein